MRYLSDCYRPEQHYMRGPGPKWLEKHAGQSGAIAVPSECHRGTSNSFEAHRVDFAALAPRVVATRTRSII